MDYYMYLRTFYTLLILFSFILSKGPSSSKQESNDYFAFGINPVADQKSKEESSETAEESKDSKDSEKSKESKESKESKDQEDENTEEGESDKEDKPKRRGILGLFGGGDEDSDEAESKEGDLETDSDLDEVSESESKLLKAIYDQNKKIDLLIEHLSPKGLEPEQESIYEDDSMDMLQLLQIVQNKFYDMDESMSGSDSLYKSLTDLLDKAGEKIESVNMRLGTEIQSMVITNEESNKEINVRIDTLEESVSSDGMSMKELEELNKDLILKMMKIDDKYASEVDRLQLEIKNLESSVSSLREINKDLVVSALTQPKEVAPSTTSATDTSDNSEQSSEDAVSTMSMNEYKSKYDEGYTLYLNSDYEGSLSVFENLLETGGINNLTDNCQYWVGEIYYSMKNYPMSIEAFNKVFLYEDNNKAAYAQYKLGLCYLNVNDTGKAVEAFEKVVSEYNDQTNLVEKSEKFIQKYR